MSQQESKLNPKDRKASAIAMRPLGAGKVNQVSAALLQQVNQDVGIEHASVAELCVKMAYCQPAGAYRISCSKVEQVQSLTEQLAATTKSEQTFHRYLAAQKRYVTLLEDNRTPYRDLAIFCLSIKALSLK